MTKLTPENRKYVIWGFTLIVVTAMITGNFDSLVSVGKDMFEWFINYFFNIGDNVDLLSKELK